MAKQEFRFREEVFRRQIRNNADQHLREECYLVVRRYMKAGDSCVYAVVKAVNLDIKPGEPIEGVIDEIFESSETVNGDTDLRIIRFKLKGNGSAAASD